MAGLYLPNSGVFGSPPASYGSVPYAPGRTATEAAFGPGATVPSQNLTSPLHPKFGMGLAFWTGVIAVGLLVVVRRSLPN